MTTLYDQYGRKVDTGRLKEEQAAPTLTGIRNIYSVEHPARAITPERLSSILQAAEFGDPYRYLEFCEDIEERDLHYLAVLSTRKESVAQLEPMIKPASEEAHDQEIADYVNDVLFERELDLDYVSMLDALGKGFSCSEIIWDNDARDTIPTRVIWRDPRWFMFDWISGNEVLVRSLRTEAAKVPLIPVKYGAEPGTSHAVGIQPATEPLLPFKFVTHVAKAKAGLPIRGGLARAAAWAYLFKIYILKDWVTFAEIYGQPLRTGKYGAGATEQDKATLLRAVANIGTDAAAIIPDSMIIEFAETNQSRASSELYHNFCTYIDESLSKCVLGQTLTTQMPKGGGGSRAAAQVHDAVRRDILSSDARRLSTTLSRDLVRPIVDLSHFGPQKHYPKFWLSLPDDQDIKTLVDVVTNLVDHGLRVGQRTMLDRLGLPEAGDDEPLLTPSKSGANAGAGDEASDDDFPAITAAQKKKRRWLRY